MVESNRAQQSALPFSSGSQVRPLRAAPIYEWEKFQILACNCTL
nr:MAG TPA: hypothetical protein [Caudoviricetes sp.]